MDLYHKILLGVVLVLVVVGAVMFRYWLSEHEAALKAQAKVEADQSALKDLATQQKAITDQIAQIRKDQADQLASVTKSFQAAQSPAQLSALLSAILKQPVTVVTPQATAANPNPQPVIQLPDTPQAKAYFQDCETCKVNYVAAQKTITADEKQAAVDKQTISLITNERDSYKELANGGPWVKRAGKALVVAVCAGAGGAAGATATHKSAGAAAGALTGAIVCTLLK